MPAKTSKYNGVSWKNGKDNNGIRRWKDGKGRWQVHCRAPGILREKNKKFIGYYDDEERAARVYNGVAKELQGSDAKLNLDGKIPADMVRLDIIELLRKKGLR